MPIDKFANWSVASTVPFIMEESVRFICVDIEAYERNQNLVTEVGFAVLDTNDILNVAPGPNGERWFPFIKAYHFRVREHSHMVNQEFVKGCPDSFNFG
jgi:hypothetical protein